MARDSKKQEKKQPTMRERVEAWYTETSRRLNPRTYLQEPVNKARENIRQESGGPARDRHIDRLVNDPNYGKAPERKHDGRRR